MKITNKYVRFIKNGLSRILFILIAISLFYCYAFSQNKYIDSLKAELTKGDLTDSVKISLNEEIGYHLNHSSPQLARRYFFEAFRLLKKNHYFMESGVALAYIGMSYEQTNQLDSAAYYIDKAMVIMKQDTSIKSKANIGSLFNEKANMDKARGLYYSAIDNYIRSNDISILYDTKEKWLNIAVTYFNIAQVFQELEQPDKATDYDKKAQQAIEAGQTATHDSAYLYLLSKIKIKTDLNIAENLVVLERGDSAMNLLDKMNKTLVEMNDDDLYAYYYAVKGDYFKVSGDWQDAEEAYRRSLEYSKNISYRKLKALLELGNIEKRLENYAGSIQYYEAALQLRPSQNKKKNEAFILKSLAEVYMLSGQYKCAANCYKKFVSLNDSLNTAGTKIKINEIENQYQAKQKQDSILVLQKNNQIQQLALHKKKSLNNMLLVGFALLLLIGILIYRNVHHRHHILKQNEALHARRIQELEKEHQLVAMQSVLKGQEEERSRLAKELHDGVGGLLSGVKLSLSTMKGNVFLSEQNAQAVNTVIEQLDQSIAELRRVSHNMMPEALIKFGLREALENYCDNLNLSGKLHIQLQSFGLATRMDQNTEIILYRIVQELLNNIVKHAKAKNVLLQIMREGDNFNLTVEDDGKGFDLKDAEKLKGAGLANIKARAEYLNGTMDIQSEPGEGTSVNIMGKCEPV